MRRLSSCPLCRATKRGRQQSIADRREINIPGRTSAIDAPKASRIQERHTVSRLVGAPPGYVGYEDPDSSRSRCAAVSKHCDSGGSSPCAAEVSIRHGATTLPNMCRVECSCFGAIASTEERARTESTASS